MNSKKIGRIYLNYLFMIAVLFMPCFVITSCVEEKQLDDIVQQTEQADDAEQETDDPAVALPGLPDDTAGYDKWLKINAEPIPPVAGGDPHNGTKNVYVNQKRETIAPEGEQQFPYPDGSIVVKEAVRPNKDYIGLIAIMRKKVGSDPDHNDWEFVEYTRNSPDDEFSILARDGTCWGCHARVENKDYVFTELD